MFRTAILTNNPLEITTFFCDFSALKDSYKNVEGFQFLNKNICMHIVS